jgi:PIN domain nuclease of toxin-antitoxin system
LSSLLLDTCAFIWLAAEPDRLSRRARTALDQADDLYLSDVCVWEIGLKWQAKKLDLPYPPRRWVTEQARLWSLDRVSIEEEHLFRSLEIPQLHRDPFDRLLVSQALVRDLTIVTPDDAIRQYPLAVLW